MSTRTAYFNNVAFNTLGLIINETVVPPVSHQKYSTISIPDGPVIFEETGKRDPVVFSIKCTVTEANKLRDIYAMASQPGTLILPDEPDKYYYGVLTIATPKNIILYYNKITFTMTAEPYAYAAVNPEITCELIDYGDIFKYTHTNNLGTASSQPRIRIETENYQGEFSIWVNHITYDEEGRHSTEISRAKFTTTGNETLIIDVETRMIYKVDGTNPDGTEKLVVSNSRAVTDFTVLELPAGENDISAEHINSFKIRMNERWF